MFWGKSRKAILNEVTLPRAIIGLAIVVGLMHFSALNFYLYWRYLWFDIVMHLLGGILVGLFAVWAFNQFIHRYKKTHNLLMLFDILLFVFIVGILWELFEYTFFFREQSLLHWTYDTVFDVIMNFTGAIIAFFLVKKGHVFRR